MFKKILVPTDGSALSDKAVNAAIEVGRQCGASLVALCVAEPYPPAWAGEVGLVQDMSDVENRALEQAQVHVDKVAAAARNAGLSCQAQAVLALEPAEEILRVAQETGCDSIFMASHGRRGLNKLFLGSETQKVLGHTHLPVLVIR